LEAVDTAVDTKKENIVNKEMPKRSRSRRGGETYRVIDGPGSALEERTQERMRIWNEERRARMTPEQRAAEDKDIKDKADKRAKDRLDKYGPPLRFLRNAGRSRSRRGGAHRTWEMKPEDWARIEEAKGGRRRRKKRLMPNGGWIWSYSK
jgi:hypothetical protein